MDELREAERMLKDTIENQDKELLNSSEKVAAEYIAQR